MELRHLRYFIMAAEEANISRAAARLNVSQPAVSRQIRDLESEFGAALFNRQPQGLSLTPAGEIALPQAKAILREAGSLTEAMQAFSHSGQRPTLKVGFIPTALPGLLAEGLKRFNRDHPRTCVQIFEMHPGEQVAALRRGELDLALPGAASRAVKAEFFTRSLRTTPLGLAVPSDHPMADRTSVELTDLADETFLSLNEERFPGRERMHRRLFALAGINPEIGLHASGLNELLGLVGSGVGIALVPTDLQRIHSSGVTFLKLRRPRMTFNFSAVWKDSDHRSEIESFVKVLAGIEVS